MRFWRFPAVAMLAALAACNTSSPVSNTELSSIYRKTDLEESRRALSEAQTLTLALACAVAERNNPNYIAMQYSVTAARMRYYQAFGAYLPEISAAFSIGQALQNSYNTVNPPLDTPDSANRFLTQTGVRASYLVFDGFARYMQLMAAKSGYRREAQLEKQTLWMLRRSVAYAYADLLYSREVMEIASRDRDFQKHMLEVARSGFSSGRRYEDEVINFHMAMRSAEADVIAARNGVEAAGYALACLMGFTDGVLPVNLQLPPLEALFEPLPYSAGECLDLVVANNPQLMAAQESRIIAEYDKYRSYSAFSPTVTANVGYTFGTNESRLDRGTYSRVWSGDFNYGMEVNWLLTNGLARYFNMRGKQELYRAAQFQVGETYISLVGATRTAHSDYGRYLASGVIYNDMIAPAFRQRELVVGRYGRYESDVDRVDRVQSTVVNCETQLAANMTGLIKSRAQLEMLLCVRLFFRPDPNDEVIESLLPPASASVICPE